MLIFMDTEFTDFVDTELISIGMVTEDGEHEFYAELPVNDKKCSDFVMEHVLPQLGKASGALCSSDELHERLSRWLLQFAGCNPVICFDYDGDWRLFCDAMSNDVPEWVRGRNIYSCIDSAALERYFVEGSLQEHHALNDAKANCHAFDRAKANDRTAFQ